MPRRRPSGLLSGFQVSPGPTWPTARISRRLCRYATYGRHISLLLSISRITQQLCPRNRTATNVIRPTLRACVGGNDNSQAVRWSAPPLLYWSGPSKAPTCQRPERRHSSATVRNYCAWKCCTPVDWPGAFGDCSCPCLHALMNFATKSAA